MGLLDSALSALAQNAQANGSGHNLPISGDQLGQVLGNNTLSGLARRLGMNPSDVAGQLFNVLPGLVGKLTPAGQWVMPAI